MADDGREGGFIKAYRQWESSPAVQALSAEGEVVWLRLLFAANWRDTEVILRSGPFLVRRGQALIAERTLAERARVSRKVVRTALARLVLSGSISVKQVSAFSGPRINLVTILNYDRFQAFDDDRAQAGPKVGPNRARSEEGEEREEGSNPPTPHDARWDGLKRKLPRDLWQTLVEERNAGVVRIESDGLLPSDARSCIEEL